MPADAFGTAALGVMPQKKMRRFYILILALTLWSCSKRDSISVTIERQYAESGEQRVDLTGAISESWERVCIFGPYSSITSSSKELGFEWSKNEDAETESNDGISRLVFIKGSSVVAYTEHPRKYGDFSNLNGKCFPQSEAKYIYMSNHQKKVGQVCFTQMEHNNYKQRDCQALRVCQLIRTHFNGPISPACCFVTGLIGCFCLGSVRP